jgi:lysophospholipase L1-like esterase
VRYWDNPMEGRGRRRGISAPLVALALVLVLTGCGTGSPASIPSPSPAAATTPGAELVLAAFGDSITAEPESICPDCTTFANRYAKALTARTGSDVTVRNQGRPSLRVEALLDGLKDGGSLEDVAASADVVIVGVGNSDAPWNITDDACDAEATAVDLVPWDRYSDECIAAEVERFRPAFDGVYGRLAALRDGKPTILRTINRYNDWIGFEGGEVPPEAIEVSVDYNVAWNAMICETAEANGFLCGDVGRAFNGPDGRTASGDLLAPDYLHPSDKGYARIAEVLVALGFAPLVE